MSPKEQAEYLVSRFIIYTNLFNPDNPNNNGWEKDIDSAKECALIAVDEIFEFMKMDDEYTGTVSNANSKWVNYFQEVKNEIKKL